MRLNGQEPLFGVNLPYFGTAYGHDLAPNAQHPGWGEECTPLLAFRTLAACRLLGFGAVRIWLCECGEGLDRDPRGRVSAAAPELLRGIELVQQGARMLGLRIYWSLLDGNSWQRDQDELTGRIFAEPASQEAFCERAVEPIAAVLDPELAFAVEIVNEPESLSSEVHPQRGLEWARIRDALARMRESVHRMLPGVPVTAGCQAVFLPGLLAGPPCVDAVDLHVYHPDGGLPDRKDLPVDIGELPLWAGECGLAERGQGSHYLLHYLYNARALPYRAAFLWKLAGDEHLLRFRPERMHAPGLYEYTPLGGEVQHFLTSAWV
ncbi:MAG: hypothetical protein JXR96_16645 [Deltaproteobacteria bacterium]|nr:hypothetical protein [Deltaproteobacteria bacterium]